MDKRSNQETVLTLDAGGTTFAFHAIRDQEEAAKPVVLPAHGDDLKACLDTLVQGFEQMKRAVNDEIQAISFAFPGPADYPNGVIGDLCNLPAFRGGVPLGPILSRHFQVPVFINNDGNLFALGEAMAGFLPQVNQELKNLQQTRRYHNLFAVTLGTGFGGGIVFDGQMLVGDCSAAGEIWLLRHKRNPTLNAEEGVSIRAIRGRYAELTGLPLADVPEPKELAKTADGLCPGDISAAKESFRCLGEVLGEALASSLTLIDGALVIGGGLSGAAGHILPAVMTELNGQINGHNRLESKVYNLHDEEQAKAFYQADEKMICQEGWPEGLPYVVQKKIPLGLSRLGTSRAVAIGAYHFAIRHLHR